MQQPQFFSPSVVQEAEGLSDKAVSTLKCFVQAEQSNQHRSVFDERPRAQAPDFPGCYRGAPMQELWDAQLVSNSNSLTYRGMGVARRLGLV